MFVSRILCRRLSTAAAASAVPSAAESVAAVTMTTTTMTTTVAAQIGKNRSDRRTARSEHRKPSKQNKAFAPKRHADARLHLDAWVAAHAATAQPSDVVAAFDDASEMQRADLSRDAVAAVARALAQVGRDREIVALVVAHVFDGHINDPATIRFACDTMRDCTDAGGRPIVWRAVHFETEMTMSNPDFPSESCALWLWAVMRLLHVPSSPLVLQALMDELTLAGQPERAVALLEEHSAQLPPAESEPLLNCQMRAYAHLRDIQGVIRTYGQFFELQKAPSLESDAVLVRALLQHSSMIELAFTTYHRQFSTSFARVIDAQRDGVLVRMIEACAMLPRDRAAKELVALLKHTRANTELEYVAAINVCRQHELRDEELLYWNAKYQLARHAVKQATDFTTLKARPKARH